MKTMTCTKKFGKEISKNSFTDDDDELDVVEEEVNSSEI